ncbi:GTPase Era [Helicobacter suis]|uniref:GTPase Era n=1 Tax=Helicobacter suis TaxID=104628 RepID=UPI0019676DA4|nr:GTPase Era [Helicobacter suis]
MSKAGFVALIGRPNAGKSTLINALVYERLCLISHKANATRKVLKAIVPYTQEGVECQMIFLDTPGICKPTKLLNQAMIKQIRHALESCDLVVFLASIHDSPEKYQEFLNLAPNKPHILALNKTDTATPAKILAQIKTYQVYSTHFSALIPLSAAKGHHLEILLKEVAKLLPEAPFYYDPKLLSDIQIKEIYKEMIREQIFRFLSEEIPYASDVLIMRVREGETMDFIEAKIIVEKESQQRMVIGKGGGVIKKIGREARLAIEDFSQKKVFLQIEVAVQKNWTQEKDQLKRMGYMIE